MASVLSQWARYQFCVGRSIRLAQLQMRSSSTLDCPRGAPLTQEQKESYARDGFIVIKNCVPKKDIEIYEKRFADIANGRVKIAGMVLQKDVAFKTLERSEKTVYKLQELYTDDVLFAYCRSDAILDPVESLIGSPNLMAVHTMLINKPPDPGTKSSRHPLHQDLWYFPFRPANKIVATWTAMERITRENGCLVAIRGSHTSDLLPHDYPDWGPDGVNKMYHGIPLDRVPSSENDAKVYLEMDAGDTVLFHPLLIHGSGINRTTGYRKAISSHFAASECEYIDVRGTSQEKIADEVLEVAHKQGIPVDDYRLVWQFRAQLVRGERINL